MPDIFAKLYALTIFTSLGGRSTRRNFGVKFFISSDADIEDASLKTNVQEIAALLQPVQGNAVHFMRGHIKQVAYNIANQPGSDFITVELDLQGTHLPANVNDPLLPPEFSLLVNREASRNRSGRIFIPNGVYASDCTRGDDGGFVLDQASAYATGPVAGLIAGLNAGISGGNTLVLPDKAGLIWTGYRDIPRHTFAGFIIRSRHTSRKSVEQAQREAGYRRLRQLEKAAFKLIGIGTIAALSPVGAAALAALQVSAAAEVAALGSAFIGYVPEFGIGAEALGLVALL